MKYAELINQSRQVFDREDCCIVGSVIVANGAPATDATCYPDIATIKKALRTGGELTGKGEGACGKASEWLSIAMAFDVSPFDEDKDDREEAYRRGMYRAKVIDNDRGVSA